MTTNGKLITAREIDGELWVRAADIETRISYTQAADGEAGAGLSDEALGELWQEINNAAARITPDRKPVWLTFARKVEAAVLARAAQQAEPKFTRYTAFEQAAKEASERTAKLNEYLVQISGQQAEPPHIEYTHKMPFSKITITPPGQQMPGTSDDPLNLLHRVLAIAGFSPEDAEYQKLHDALLTAQRDAARYRFIRTTTKAVRDDDGDGRIEVTPEGFDATVDAAMLAAPTQQENKQ
jgi:hypothetical protein